MPSFSILTRIEQQLSGLLHKNVTITDVQAIGGGSINITQRIVTNQGSFFCKQNSAQKFPNLFQKESTGLQHLQQQGVIATPDVIFVDEFEEAQVLVLEWIESGIKTNNFWKTFGEQLAALHRCTHPLHGFKKDNYMGSVPQRNTPEKSWIFFLQHHRLQPLVDMCLSEGLFSAREVKNFETLYTKLPLFFSDDEPPSLLHGDLWSGNLMCNVDSQPVLIDPAVYYGHHSMDLGMTTLFGGFHPLFYEAYHYHFPMPPNSKEQQAICKLYPLLIHLLLFGKSYLSDIQNTLHKFV